MRLHRTGSRYAHLAILRAAALLVPDDERAEWLAEWKAELWYAGSAKTASRRGSEPAVYGKTNANAFCLGAFQDALWLRRNSPVRPFMQSPTRCLALLAAAAAVSVFIAVLLPGVRNLIPAFRNDTRSLALISAGESIAAGDLRHLEDLRPSLSIEKYQWLKDHTRGQFTDLAFVLPGLSHVRISPYETAELSIARVSGNFFQLLDISVLPLTPGPYQSDGGSLVLREAVWRKHFGGTTPSAARMFQIAGRQARVDGVISKDPHGLFANVDGWLLEDGRRDDVISPDSNAFVFGRPSPPTLPNRRWSIFLRSADGRVARFHCVTLPDEIHQSFAGFLLLIGLACLIVWATSSLSLGEYPANQHSLPWSTRVRRWIFLGAKIALTSLIVYAAALDLGYLTTSANVLIQFSLWGSVFAFRWILRDQRQRCPVCLTLLGQPVRVGELSGYFLEWNCTELLCPNGHGLLYVPETATSWFNAQRWIYLEGISGLRSKRAGMGG